MSDSPLTDESEGTREERLYTRLTGLIQFQSKLFDKVRAGYLRPYCYIPDLFEFDPEAKRPFSVPGSFIPEQVGGNVSVVNTDGTFLTNESLNFMLSSFLPGGYKRRWEFDMWTGNYEPSSKSGFAAIDDGLRIRTAETFDAILPETDIEQYTPYKYDTDDVRVIIPFQFLVWSPTVDEQGRFMNLYWDELNKFIHNHKPEGVPEESLRELKSDPTSQFLWFKHLLDRGSERSACDLEDVTNGLFQTATFSDNASFLKAHYATLLTLYGEDRTFSEVLRYRHEAEDSIAFVGSKEQSQVVLFESETEGIEELVAQSLKPHSPLYRDLQFALFYRLIWDRLFFQDEALEHAFTITPFFNAILALDYSLAVSSDSPDSVFEADLDVLQQLIPSLLPDTESRLGLLDYDETQLAEYSDLLEEHWDTIDEFMDEVTDEDRLHEFAVHVFVHSLKHATASWAAEYSAGGTNFEAWYDINFQERDADTIQIGIYDSIQGGAGVSKEIYDDIESIQGRTILEGIGSQGCCHISGNEELVKNILQGNSGEYIFDLVQSIAGSAGKRNPELVEAFHGLGIDYRHIRYEDVQPLVHRRLKSLAETQEMARFYTAVSGEYSSLEKNLNRTPRSVDVVFGLEDRTFFDPRVKQTYERFANRRSQRRDISELAERVEEITKQCIHACPDCLKRQSCTHQYRYQEEMLDRRLLTRVLAALAGDVQ